MTALQERAAIQMWERGHRQRPTEKALAMLSVAFPESGGDQLASLTIGERDARLLQLHVQLFGPSVEIVANCPACGEWLEFAVNLADLQIPADAQPMEKVYRLSISGYQLTYRLPDSIDLVALAHNDRGSRDLEAARQLLLGRCLLEAVYQDQPITAADLPEPVCTALSAEMARRDPQAQHLLNIACAACGAPWQASFDIVAFLWAKIETQAQALLREVHVLARAYGWSEADIQALSPARRQFYLERVMG